VVLGLPAVPPVGIQDPELVDRESSLQEVQVQITVPLDRDGYNSAFDGKPVGFSESIIKALLGHA